MNILFNLCTKNKNNSDLEELKKEVIDVKKEMEDLRKMLMRGEDDGK